MFGMVRKASRKGPLEVGITGLERSFLQRERTTTKKNRKGLTDE